MSNIYQSELEVSHKAKEINLRDLYRVIKRRIWVVLIVTIFAASAGVVKSNSSVSHQYQTSSRIIIGGVDDQSRTTLQVIIRDSTVLDKVISQLNLHTSSETLANQITVSSIDNSQVVSISVIDSNPVMAAKIADTTAKVFKAEVPKIVGGNNILLLSKAKINPTPINSGHKNTIIIYTICGFILGIGLVFLLDSLDNSIRSEEEIEKLLNIPVVGKVSKIKKIVKRNKKIAAIEIRGETIGSK